MLFFCIGGNVCSTLVLPLSHIGATFRVALVLLFVSCWCSYLCCIGVVVDVMLVLLPFTCSCYCHPMLVLLFVTCWCWCLFTLVLLPFHIGAVTFSHWCYYPFVLVLLLSLVGVVAFPCWCCYLSHIVIIALPVLMLLPFLWVKAR
jgi:hypothetical protein